MRKIWNIISIFGLVLLLLTQFTNCDVYSDNQLFTTMDSSCTGQDCFAQSSEFLELRVNSANNVLINSSVQDFNLGGDCNEGGFASNIIIWELFLYNSSTGNWDMVRSSSAVHADSVCTRGRFSLYLVLGATSYDSANRTGLVIPGTSIRVQHKLEVEIKGIDDTGATVSNVLMARKRIYLNPIF